MPSPIKLTAYLLIIWLASTAIAPFSFDIEYGIYPTALIVGATLLFFLGALTTNLLIKKNQTSPQVAIHETISNWQNSRNSKKLLWLISLVALAGCALRAYDRLFSRGLIYAGSVTDVRLSLGDLGESSGAISAIAGILFSLSYAVFCLGRTLWPRLTIAEKIFVTCISIYPIIEGLAQGGIMAAAAASLYYYFVHKTITQSQQTFEKKTRNKRRTKIMMMILAITIFVMSSIVYVDRVTHMYDDITLFMTLSEANGTINYSDNAFKIVEALGAIGFIPIWLLHYFTLGIHELYYLINNFDGDNYFYGQYQIYILIKFLKLFGLFTEVSLSNFYFANPMPGHYQTFWGPAYMDFGPFFLIEAALAGSISTFFYRKYMTGKAIGIAVYPYLMVFIILGFLANGLVGERLYFLISLLLFAYIAQHTLRK